MRRPVTPLRGVPTDPEAGAVVRAPARGPRPVRRARALALACAVGLLLSPAVGGAEQVILGLEQGIDGQSNLFRSTVGSIADGNYEISPYVRVLGEHTNVGYSIEYRPSYEVYFVSDDVDGLDHFFRTTLVYDVLPVSRLRLRADVADYRSVRAVAADSPSGIPDVIPQATGDINRSFVNLEYEHEVTRATVVGGGLYFQSYAYTTPNNADSLGFAGEASVMHRLTADFGLGGSLLASHRRFDELPLRPSSDNTVANANVLLLYEPTPSWFLELSAGPAVIFTRQDPLGPQVVSRWSGVDLPDLEPIVRRYRVDPLSPPACTLLGGQPLLSTCPVTSFPGFVGIGEQVVVGFDPGTQTTSADQDLVTGFVTAEIRKEDSWGLVSLAYFRGEDASAGIGTTTVRDSVTATVIVRPFWQVEVRMRGNWNRREATGATNRFAVRAGPSTIVAPTGDFVAEANGLIDTGLRTETEITQYWADLLATREIVDRLWIDLGFRYLKQERVERPGGTATEFDNYIGSLTVRYELPPFDL
jgi:hypothetical protein